VEAGGRIAELEARLSELTEALALRDARIATLEGLLEASRPSGKRQAAPFRKGEPKSGPVPGARATIALPGTTPRRTPAGLQRTSPPAYTADLC